jgi:carboxypeptidase C (cathepsin A)
VLTLACSAFGQQPEGRRPEQRPPEQQPTAPAGEPPQAAPHAEPAARPPQPAPEPAEEKPVITHHSITVNGKTLKYTATTGFMPLRDNTGKLEGRIFYMAYTLDNPPAKRPLTFSFNGGPGSSSVWLHLGAIGPRRVKMELDGWMPKPPFQLVDNQYTWLDQTDLVFIDPIGTGYSRAVTPEIGKKFWGVQGDLESVGEFIRMYLVRNQRFGAPLFIVGESYGTFRAAGLAGYLVNRGIAVNGVMLISTVLNFATLEFTRMNDLAYELMLPSYTTTAWYHKKLPADLQQDFRNAMQESESFALGDYSTALNKGDALTPQERDAAADKMSRYTGLSKEFCELSNFRVPLDSFLKELLRSQKRTLGRLDSRFEGWDASATTGHTEYDPSMSAIIPPYTSTFYDYVRDELGYKSDLTYYILGGGIGPWDMGTQYRGGFADTSELLRQAFAKNPFMHLFVAKGYYDMATPFFAADYTIDHLGLDPSARKNVTMAEFEAGHMMYSREESLAKLRKDIAAFYENALR